LIDYLRDFQDISFGGSLNGCFGLAFAWVGVLEEEKEKATLLNHTLYNSIGIKNGKVPRQDMKPNGIGLRRKDRKLVNISSLLLL
jgi:hypothetical protein